MARRRGVGGEPDAEGNDIEAPEHAWWAEGSTDPYEYARPGAAAEPEVEAEPEPVEDETVATDPYEVLRVPPTATWDEIVAAHRRLVRWWHPDGLAPDASDEERDLCDTRMRELNEAYRALRVRRDR